MGVSFLTWSPRSSCEIDPSSIWLQFRVCAATTEAIEVVHALLVAPSDRGRPIAKCGKTVTAVTTSSTFVPNSDAPYMVSRDAIVADTTTAIARLVLTEIFLDRRKDLLSGLN